MKAKVKKGWVTLEGELSWNFQSDAAFKAVTSLEGVTGVSIESARERNWSVTDQDIPVDVSGHKATLTRTVDSGFQKDEASRIAWNAPGVWTVANELMAEYD